MIGEQSYVLQLDLLPQCVGQARGVEVALQPFDRLVHAIVVELDAIGVSLAHRVPLGALEPAFGLAADLAEQAIVLVEAFQQGMGDGEGDLAGGRRGAGEQLGHRFSVRSAISRRAYFVSSNSSRPISHRRISEVPAPIS